MEECDPWDELCRLQMQVPYVVTGRYACEGSTRLCRSHIGGLPNGFACLHRHQLKQEARSMCIEPIDRLFLLGDNSDAVSVHHWAPANLHDGHLVCRVAAW